MATPTFLKQKDFILTPDKTCHKDNKNSSRKIQFENFMITETLA